MAPVGYLDTGVIYCDDNLHRLSQFPAESVDLIYLDPPFFSNRQYEVIWGDEAEVRSFEDRWEGGVHVYTNWMRERVMEMHRILKTSGTLYLHCDWHASHYLKVMLDEIFSESNFLNEIVWCYETGGRSKSWFPRKHDTIFRYGKSKKAPFYYEQVAIARDFTTMHETVLVDEDGRQYQRNIKAGKEYRYYVDQGVLPNDWWADIQALNPAAKERLGWPTQKPEALLARIISASSKRGDIVMDPFAGCGTAMVVAEKLGRQWIGIDISPTAVGLMQWRMSKAGATAIKLVGMPVSEGELRKLKPFEFQNWVVQRMNATHAPRKVHDMGIDGYSFMLHEPIQVKQSDAVGRNVIDNFQTAMARVDRMKGYVVAFSYTKGAREEVARVKPKGIDIELLTVADLLENKADLVTPESGLWGRDVPLPPAREADARPSVDELVASDQGASDAAE